jgi:hypothetical protein
VTSVAAAKATRVTMTILSQRCRSAATYLARSTGALPRELRQCAHPATATRPTRCLPGQARVSAVSLLYEMGIMPRAVTSFFD